MSALRHLRVAIIVYVATCLAISKCQTENVENEKARSEDSLDSQQFIRIHSLIGREVQLQCNLQSNQKRLRAHRFVWQYKRCGKPSNMLPCNATLGLEDDWKLVPCAGNGKTGCKATLDLGRATADLNGLYRCLFRNNVQMQKTPTTFLLEIDADNVPESYGLDMDNAPDYPMETLDPPVEIFRPAGGEVELRCKSKTKLPSSHRNQHGVIWHYKKCGFRNNLAHCSQFVKETDLSGWMVVICGGYECNNKILNLGKPREEDNGLYRCSFKNKQEQAGKIVATYELDIVDSLLDSSPEILGDSPVNMSVLSGQSASFQCRMRSPAKPTIIWLRRRDTDTFTDELVRFLNGTYVRLASDQVSFPDNNYLSKLVIPTATTSDEGIYVCVAINNHNFKYREAFLTVIPKYFSTNDTSSEYELSSLHWLFLIPATLALIPATVWLCCLWRRRKGVRVAKAPSDVAPPNGTINNNLCKQSGGGFKYMQVPDARQQAPNGGS